MIGMVRFGNKLDHLTWQTFNALQFRLKGATFFLEGTSRKFRTGQTNATSEKRNWFGNHAHGRCVRVLCLQRPGPRCQHPGGHEHQHHRTQ